MPGAAAVLGCLCLLLPLLLPPDVSGAGAEAGTTSRNTEYAANDTTASLGTSESPLHSTGSEGMTGTKDEGSTSKSNEMSSTKFGSPAASATTRVSSGTALIDSPDTKSSTVGLSTSVMDTTQMVSEEGTSISTVTVEISTTSSGGGSMVTMSQPSMTSGAKGFTTHEETIGSNASTSGRNSVISMSTGTQASAGGTASEISSARGWTPTGQTATLVTTSENANTRNQTSVFTTTRHSMTTESQTVTRANATSTVSTISKTQLTTETGGSLFTSSKITTEGNSSTLSTKSFSTPTLSPGNQTDSTEHVTASTTDAPTVENYCKNVSCPPFSSCVSGLTSYICRCPLGLYFQPPATCVTGKIFQGFLHLGNLSYSLEMENPNSLAFKTTAADIEHVLSVILKNQPGYVRSIVEKLTNGSVKATVSNFFNQSSPVTNAVVTRAIQDFIHTCRNCGPLQKNDTYLEKNLCGPDTCDLTTTTCQSSDGEFSCQCKDGYYKRFPMDRGCMACSSGYGLQNTTCVVCPFGYGGFNCADASLLALVIVSCVLGSLLLILLLVLLITCCRSKATPNTPSYEQEPYLRWPKQEALKIPRVTMSWDSSQIEMQENGSRSNLMENPVGNGNVVDANRTDNMRTFTCKNPTRYSYLCQGQENPYFISDDHAQVNLK